MLITKDLQNSTENYYLYGHGLISQGGVSTQNRQYYLEDGRGNIRFVTDSAGSKVAYYDYDPYGSKVGGDTFNDSFLYKGEQLHAGSNLYYMRARYYDPTTGRFISKDPVEGTVSNPLSQNGYGFVHGDPVNNSDPSGEILETAWDAANLAYDIATFNPCDPMSYVTLGYDAFATLVPILPAGVTKVGKVANIASDAKRFTPDQAALVDLAKDAQKTGVSSQDAETLLQWAKEYDLPYRGPEVHPNRPYGQYEHIHVGPVDHIFIK